MEFSEIADNFFSGIKQTGWIEYIAVFSGILSVWYSRKENVLVYPIGLINTVFYTYLSFKGHLLGEASVNIYYTIMSIYGWVLWTKKDEVKNLKIRISDSSNKELFQQIIFFVLFFIIIFFALTELKKNFAEGAIPWADAFASATAFTGMWLMAKKKVESWVWWILTNIASVPLYFVKGYVFTSVYYLILFFLAIAGLIEWNKRARLKYE